MHLCLSVSLNKMCLCVPGLDSDESCEGTSEASFKDAVVYGGAQKNNGAVPQNGIKKHRSSLPAPMFSRNDFSVWSILKKCIGLELSKITMPIVFNEPLSFLQRISEYMEHTYLIQKACSQSDTIERMQTVAAFAVSAVASQWDRTGKPFNPLLGETYELTRDDQGFRLISEQVSHHPPISAFHTESLTGDFVFHGSIYPKLKFWGKSVEAEPKGTITLELYKHKEAYTWTNPFCCVHNIILGKLWIEQYGTVEIVNHSTGEKCVLNFKPCGMFGKELHRVEGYIQDKSKKKRCVIYGKWTECMWSVDPQVYECCFRVTEWFVLVYVWFKCANVCTAELCVGVERAGVVKYSSCLSPLPEFCQFICLFKHVSHYMTTHPADCYI
uniref:Oxysterol-binding protein n=1 Tax=Sinocyclocheilus grahami TaxID=75366 RepID=A0A672R3K5_SINGR